jgi:hypothetical protein
MKALLPLALALTATSAHAETLKTVPTQLDPGKAYVLIEYRLAPNPLNVGPGARKYLPLVGLTFARYDSALGDIRGMGKAQANPVPNKQPAVEPFRNRELAKSDDSRLYLLEIEPDTWVIQAWGGTSFSLGSYSFQPEPGTVTDLGVATYAADWAEGEHAPTMGDVMKMALVGPFAKPLAIAPARVSFRPRTGDDLAVPAGLPADKVRPVAFTPGAKFGNYLGGTVNRIEGANAMAKARAGGAPAQN